MKKKAIIIGSLVALVVLAVLLYQYTSRDLAIKRVREKWGAANPSITATDQAFEGKSLAELQRMLAVGLPGWVVPSMAGWQYQ